MRLFGILSASAVAAFAAALVVTTPVSAQDTEQPKTTKLGEFNDWEAHTYQGEQGKVCYVLSRPKQMLPTNREHGDVYFFVTDRPAEGVTNEASVLVGYTFADGSTVTVDVDGTKFTMFTKADGAWMEDPADEQKLVDAMRAGRDMTVSGRSSRGTNTTYKFSLSGVTASTDRINRECG